MKYTFDYEEKLERRIVIEADSLGEALNQFYQDIENQTIVLDANDFVGATLRMPFDKDHNRYLLGFERYGEDIKQEILEDNIITDIVIDYW